jgi:hypothetical protein
MRVQQPQVHQRTDRSGSYWFFRYWQEESLPDGSIKTTRRFHSIRPIDRGASVSREEAGGATRSHSEEPKRSDACSTNVVAGRRSTRMHLLRRDR